VIANAGLGDSAPLGSIREEQFDRVFNVNVKGVLFTAQKALPLLSSTGTIVIIGSTASIEPPAGMSMYGGAKAAVFPLQRGVPLHHRRRAVRRRRARAGVKTDRGTAIAAVSMRRRN
jgi:NAD(P)-dependent dehydrogenase (short-subunit alcohol dehydrogenase family)